MISTTLPKGVRSVADNLKDCFENRSYQNITAVIAYFLLNQHSISEFVRSASFTKSVSTTARVFHSFDKNRAARRLFAAGIKAFKDSNQQDLVYIVDDTANPKYGKKLFATSYWGSSNGVYFGRKVLTIAIVDTKRKISVPVSYAIIDKMGRGDETILDTAVKLLSELIAYGFPITTVVADSWFDSREFSESLEKLGLRYIWQVKSNRLVKTNPSPYKPWEPIAQAFVSQPKQRTITTWDQRSIRMRRKKGKCIAKIYCQIKERRTPLKIIAVNNRRNSASAFGYFASTDRSFSRARIWEISRARWAIETIFRTVKQNLSFGRTSCQGEEAAHLAVMLPFYLYTQMTSREPSHWGLSRRQSLDRMLATLRNESLMSTVEKIIYRPTSDDLKLLKNRRNRDTVSKKPTNMHAGSQGRAA